MVNGRCDICGIPVDAEHFDVWRILTGNELPQPGQRAVLASFELHPQYCGVLTCFSQFTNTYAEDNSRVLTPGLEWSIQRNGQPIFPYQKMEAILNPWGYGSYGFSIRLDQNARVEFVVKNRDFVPDPDGLNSIGGRLMGRYWYNAVYGGERD